MPRSLLSPIRFAPRCGCAAGGSNSLADARPARDKEFPMPRSLLSPIRFASRCGCVTRVRVMPSAVLP
jgi:hypothetical protein